MFNFIISDIHIKFVNDIGSAAIILLFWVITLLEEGFMPSPKNLQKYGFIKH